MGALLLVREQLSFNITLQTQILLSPPVQSFYRDLVKIAEISMRLTRSRRDLAMMFARF